MDIVGSLLAVTLLFSGVGFYVPGRILTNMQPLGGRQHHNGGVRLQPSEPPSHPGVVDLRGARERVSNDVARQRRDTVQKMMKHAWDSYVHYAWGENELRPISKKGRSSSLLATRSLGETIVASLDTLYIMGMMDEFKQGRDWIEENLHFDNLTTDVSLFQATERIVGALLSCYAFTGDVMFRDKAAQLTEKMLPAFQTQTGIPRSIVDLKSGWCRNNGWVSGGCSILAECGGLHLEFAYLSDVTDNPMYRAKVERVRETLKSMDKPNGLYPNFVHPTTGKSCQPVFSLGGYGDVFYEYLLKAWIQSGKADTEARQMYDEAIESILKHVMRVSAGGLTYISDMRYNLLEHKMGHLACFSGGLIGLGAHTRQDRKMDHYMDVAERVTNTCHEAYNRSVAKLAPEVLRFTASLEAEALRHSERGYYLQAQTVESYCILWRLTKNPKYREWGWEVVQALEKQCRVPGGYAGLKTVHLADGAKDDLQQSFFLAETLKYLYLLFSDDDLISLDQWVFNTEGHPLPIKRVNPYYRPFSL